MTEPYKHKLGEFGPEHFDGDPIDRGPPTPALKQQTDEANRAIIERLGMPQNNIERQQQQGAPKGPKWVEKKKG